MGAFNDVVDGLGTLRVSGKSVFLAKGVKIFSSSEDFVDVGLVSGIENDAVIWRVKHLVNSDGSFNNTQVWTEVTSSFCNLGD
ncbi:unannotated protein [freshwater metagenome]|uniref:Unannotated protein n=1 Tax=freshwater metagenome TaxID=449393 RepID=A0A6J6JK87_9ZZZZ